VVDPRPKVNGVAPRPTSAAGKLNIVLGEKGLAHCVVNYCRRRSLTASGSGQRCTPDAPAERSAGIDFASWLRLLQSCRRKITLTLASGETTNDVAEQFSSGVHQRPSRLCGSALDGSVYMAALSPAAGSPSKAVRAVGRGGSHPRDGCVRLDSGRVGPNRFRVADPTIRETTVSAP
jgi:hypothetical protein